MNAVYQELGPCPCRYEWDGGGWELVVGRPCDAEGTKLTKFGHLVGCNCGPCRGRRNQRKGKRSEARGEKQLGNQGRTIGDDRYRPWPLEVSLEDKTGDQIPANFLTFIGLEWTRKAFRQAEKKRPIGEDTFPALRLELSPSRAFLVVDISPRKP